MKQQDPTSAENENAAWLDCVEVVLCRTSMAENLGAAARAMKTMGLSRLVLVSPVAGVDDKARAVATHAADILDNARVVEHVEQAVADSVAVWAATARPRNLQLPQLEARDAAEVVRDQAAGGRVSLLFGAERTGLTNEELAVADRLVAIQANPDYPVLNLGQAVQLIAYELHHAARAPVGPSGPGTGEPPAVRRDIATLCRRLEALLGPSGFFDAGGSGEERDRRAERLMRRLRVMLNRAEPRREELQILQGMITALERRGPTDKA
ncbi:MAG: RNA methyltransferase [Pseudomonadota bacterium]